MYSLGKIVIVFLVLAISNAAIAADRAGTKKIKTFPFFKPIVSNVSVKYPKPYLMIQVYEYCTAFKEDQNGNKDCLTPLGMKDAEVKIYKGGDIGILKGQTNKNGLLKAYLKPGEHYKIMAEKEGFKKKYAIVFMKEVPIEQTVAIKLDYLTNLDTGELPEFQPKIEKNKLCPADHYYDFKSELCMKDYVVNGTKTACPEGWQAWPYFGKFGSGMCHEVPKECIDLDNPLSLAVNGLVEENLDSGARKIVVTEESLTSNGEFEICPKEYEGVQLEVPGDIEYVKMSCYGGSLDGSSIVGDTPALIVQGDSWVKIENCHIKNYHIGILAMPSTNKDSTFDLLSYDNKFENNTYGIRAENYGANVHVVESVFKGSEVGFYSENKKLSWGYYFSGGNVYKNEFCSNTKDILMNFNSFLESGNPESTEGACKSAFDAGSNACDSIEVVFKDKSLDCGKYICEWQCYEEVSK